VRITLGVAPLCDWRECVDLCVVMGLFGGKNGLVYLTVGTRRPTIFAQQKPIHALLFLSMLSTVRNGSGSPFRRPCQQAHSFPLPLIAGGEFDPLIRLAVSAMFPAGYGVIPHQSPFWIKALRALEFVLPNTRRLPSVGRSGSGSLIGRS